MSKPSHTVALTKLVLYFNFLLWHLGAHQLKYLARADALLPDDEEFKIHDEELPPLYIALIAIGSTIIGALVLLAFTWLLRSRNSPEIKVGGAKTEKGTREKVVTLEELIDATGKFSDRKMVGSGSIGTVYVAQLQGPSRTTVAVKRLYSHFEEVAPKLKKEVKWVYELHHENLIKLFDYQNEKDCQLLVYEYMENLSLEDALTDMRSLKFTWDTRFKICLGIARGLEYLHNHPRLHFAHMNIKAGNILLDGELEPKITDFGLGYLYVEEDQFKLIETAVTQGYIAPEYFQDCLTSKADVYSFGVILLEIVCWKKNKFKSRHGTEFLVDMAHKKNKQGNLEDMIDKTLVTCDNKQAMTAILKLAVRCTSMSPTVRPSMSEVVSDLLNEPTTDEHYRSMPSTSYPSTETKYEKESISEDIPVGSRDSITIKEGEETTRKGRTGEILVTLKELIDATGKFINKKIIRSDSLGTVYVAPLQVSTNVTVAVKSLSSNFRRNIQDLRKEIKFLYTLDHENILKLSDFHIEKDHRLLVYEYIRKSLEDALTGSSDTRLKFTWDTRFRICLGIARGLEYLHNHRRLNIVHMDIRPGNILLDRDLQPKISGFGMARHSVEEDQFECNIKVASSPYMAPELFRGVFTIKADVYSFGIILLQIVSGQENVRSHYGETEFLADRAYMLRKEGKLLHMMDKTLHFYDSKQALIILNLALKCINIEPRMRPSMSEVVSVLLNEKKIESSSIACADTSMPSTSSPSTDTKYELDTISVHIPTKS